MSFTYFLGIQKVGDSISSAQSEQNDVNYPRKLIGLMLDATDKQLSFVFIPFLDKAVLKRLICQNLKSAVEDTILN